MEQSENPRIRVAAVIVQEGKILLVRHVKDGKTYWLVPGGGVDYGESLAEAVARELKEEACLDIRVGELILANDSIPPDKSRHIVNLYFSAEIVGGQVRLGEDERVAELRFVPLDDLADLVFYPDIRAELLDAIKQNFAMHAAYVGNLWK